MRKSSIIEKNKGFAGGNVMKKRVRGAGLVLSMALVLLCGMNAKAVEIKEWTIGFEENKNGAVDEEQGANGWYFLYGEETDTDGKLDPSKLKECVWSDSGSCWLYYGIDAMWMPEKYAEEDYDCNESKNWWRMDSNGIMNAGSDNYRSVIAWEAPESGSYSINLEYTAGSDSYEWEGVTYYADGGDGLLLSINTEDEVLEKAECGVVSEDNPELSTGTMSAKADLKKGEKVYISSDPGPNVSCDSTTVKVKILQLEGAGDDAETAKNTTGSGIKIKINENFAIIGIAMAGILLGFVSVLIRKKHEAL